jgi:hypothetical protein
VLLLGLLLALEIAEQELLELTPENADLDVWLGNAKEAEFVRGRELGAFWK